MKVDDLSTLFYKVLFSYIKMNFAGFLNAKGKEVKA